MDDGGIIAGAVIAIIAGMIVPFLTTQFSLWSEMKRDLYRARRQAIDALVDAENAVIIRSGQLFREARATGQPASWMPDLLDKATTDAARARIRSLLTTADGPINEVLAIGYDYRADLNRVPPETYVILATWAAGREIRARRAARRLLEVHRQRDKDTPKDEDTSAA